MQRIFLVDYMLWQYSGYYLEVLLVLFRLKRNAVEMVIYFILSVSTLNGSNTNYARKQEHIGIC